MKQKLGIFTALILSLTIVGSALAGNFQASAKNSPTAASVKSSKTKKAVKPKKHRKHHKSTKKSAMKKDASATPPSK